MVKRKLTVGGLIGHLASVSHFHKILFCFLIFPTCNFFLEYDPRFSVAPFQLRPDKDPKTFADTPSLS